MPEIDPRAIRLAELRSRLERISIELGGLEPGSPEQVRVLERWGPVHAAVLALAEELSE